MISYKAHALRQITQNAVSYLTRLTDSEAASKPSPEKWSKKEILGHLIDSAVNNHHRFVRAQSSGAFSFPGYEQDFWVTAQAYQNRSWTELLRLWEAYNYHLAHVISVIPEGSLQKACQIGSYAPVTLLFLVEDYLTHLTHHLHQLGVNTAEKS